MAWIAELLLCCTSSKSTGGQQVRQAELEARLDLRMHLPERHRAGLLPLLIIDEHRGQGALRNLEVAAPHEKAFPRFGALPGSGDVIQDPVPPLVSDSQKIAPLEGIHAEVALVQEPAPRHHPLVVQSGVGSMSLRPIERYPRRRRPGRSPLRRPGQDATSCCQAARRSARRSRHCGTARQGRPAEATGTDGPS